jgi:UTP-glucose-1-phosphate uridylyltransferase
MDYDHNKVREMICKVILESDDPLIITGMYVVSKVCDKLEITLADANEDNMIYDAMWEMIDNDELFVSRTSGECVYRLGA